MGGDKQGSKRGGSYVGGFFQLFDWNAKSRKKLFASKSDLPEQSKQKKRTEGNLPATRFYLDEATTGYSIKGSDHSCASSMTDEDGYGSKAPGVVARLMGLDSLPFAFNDTSSQGRDNEYQSEKLDDLVKLHQKTINKPIEKFQTEILPPRSAKSIPITHHKLLSPVKRPGFVPSYKEAADIMEAASKIIEPALLQSNSKKGKLPSLGTPPSIPLKTKDLKEKASSSKVSVASKGQTSNVKADSDDLTDVQKKAKTISLALQAKVNVQRREGLNQNTSKNAFGQKDSTSNRTLKTQPNHSSQKKPCGNNSSNVLRPNNQKQNCPTDNRENQSALKPSLAKSQGRRTLQGDSSLKRDKTQNNSRPSGNSKIGSRKYDQDSGSNGKQDVSFSTTKTVSRKKRVIDKNETPVPSDSLTDRQKGVDIVSFTFTAPMTRSEKNESFQRQMMALEKSDDFITEHNNSNRGKKMNLLEYNNVIGGDALSALLEQKLRELTNGAESSSSSCNMAGSNSFSASVSKDSVSMKTFSEFSSTDPETLDGEKMDLSSRNTKQFLQRFSSPISVFDHSSESADSNSIESSRLCSSSSVQAQQVVDVKSFKFNSMETNVDLSDSASSISTALTKNQELDLYSTNEWKLEYVKEILTDVELMFDDYALGQSEEMMNPQVFDRVESEIDDSGSIIHNGETCKLKRNILFDCVSESLELRCRNYTAGSCKAFEKGVSTIRRKDRLAEEVYKEISAWGEMGGGDTMVDDLVDRDMSSQHGKWLDFEVEGFETGLEIQDQILDELMEEVIADLCKL
ncbi:uncharacterized protein LOC124917863 [Impatiens glandulifera]|uniref:uncharacterized protein LOC124917863 n=1 Tax=Impatiens glandulifera TaxID=253017 RepID=UPI001FB146A6|nr:uncharacterized protein LOC124917863 [Impatiens glandulifera]XP_047314099.1 uncharacterized protein LOC124917863 [Impatiens glandulifera]XP_047314100.1 uncharacterized protein LOC124917863 [Impatiens glandulifera]